MFIKKITQNIHRRCLIEKDDHVLAGVSGGPDSMCMLVVLRELSQKIKYRLTVAHFNHMLRGEESDGDAKFVKDHCSSLAIPFVGGEEDVSTWRKKHGGSREEAARTLRYRFFKEEAERLSANKIALAHHADDQAETVLMRILRGAGTGGLAGILPVRNGLYIRPLLFVTQNEIHSYLKKNKLPFREDRSNLEPDCLRNRVRLQLMPELREQYNPRITGALGRIAEISREEDEFLEEYTEGFLVNCLSERKKDRIVIKRSLFIRFHPAIRRRMIRSAVKHVKSDLKRLSYAHMEDAMELLEKEAVGKSLNWPGGIRVLFSYETLTITSEKKTAVMEGQTPFPIPGTLSFLGKKIIAQTAGVKEWEGRGREIDTVAWLDRKKLSSELVLKSRTPGDRFQPLGMSCEKKLKDFFIDRKIPAEERDELPLLVSNGKIVWIGGIEVSELVKIDGNTEDVVRILMK